VTTAFWNDATVREALGLDGVDGSSVSFSGVSTDTRTVGAGDLFVALRGERFDAHEFLGTAAESGATGAVVSRVPADAPAGLVLFVVEDTLQALQRLGTYRRDRLRARFVGVVGSNGKTTTKELVRAALATRYETYATRGNLNNQIGVPQTLLAIPEATEVAVVEMGTDRPGEVAALTRIVRPDVAVVTSIGEEHLEWLGDLEGVLREEISVVEGLAAGGVVLVAEEPEELARRARERVGAERVRVAGLGDGADLRPEGGMEGIEVAEDGSTRWRWRGHDVTLPIPGRVNVRNALLALGVALEMGVPEADAVRGLAGVILPKLRGEWHRYGDGMRVLADCYNANPPSLMAAVDMLATLPGGTRRVAVLGTMRELGESSGRLHREAADFVASRVGKGIDLVVATGDFVDAFAGRAEALGGGLVVERDPVEAYRVARETLSGDETILLKGSRGDRMERWLPLLERDFGGAATGAAPAEG